MMGSQLIENINQRILRFFLRLSNAQWVHRRASIIQSNLPLARKTELKQRLKLNNLNEYYYSIQYILNCYKKYSQTPVEQATAFEIGAGSYLMSPIGLSLLGFQKIITVDICRAIPEYVQIVCKYLARHKHFFGMRSVPKIKEKLTNENLDEALLRNFNVDYRAPYDAAHTDLADSSIDYIYSKVTFEHIRAELLPGIVNEMYRILREGGICYITIDFNDHRAYKYPKISCYDFLQYSNAEYLELSKDCYLNRWRLRDFLELFTAVGFEIVNIDKFEITEADRTAFAKIKVADEFRQKYTNEELLEKGATIILRKP